MNALNAQPTGNRCYRYYDEPSGKWWISSEGDVQDLGERIIALDEAIEDGTADEGDTCSYGALYSRWCGDTESRQA